MSDAQSRLSDAADKAEIGADILQRVAEGDENTEVPTAGGVRPSVAKWFKDRYGEFYDWSAGILSGNLAAAARAEVGADRAEAARDAALLSRGIWPTTAAGIGQGVAGVASVVPGSGGTNGTFALGFSGGTQVLAPQGYFVVAAGIVTQVVITYPGYYSAGTPTLSFSASAGLTGASATAVMAANTPVGAYFSTPAAPDFAQLYRVDAGPVAVEVGDPYPSSASLAFLDRTAEQLVYGGQAIVALADSEGRALAAWLLDGVLRGKIGLVAPGSSSVVSLAFSPTTGLTTVDVPSMQVGQSQGFVAGREIIGGLFDADGRAFLSMERGGETYTPRARCDSLTVAGELFSPVASIADTADYAFFVAEVDGIRQIIRRPKSGGALEQVTFAGANYSPFISDAHVVYRSSRETPASLWCQPVGGGPEHPYESTRLIVPVGNSISTTSQGYVTALAALRPGDTMSVQGVSGQRTDDIAYRLGALPVSLSVTSGSIPASGGVTVTGLAATLFRRTSGSAAVRAIVAGVPGILSVAGGVTTFTRSEPGSVVAVINPVGVTITSGFIDGSTDPSTQLSLDTLLSGTAVLVVTYNDIKEATYSQATTLAYVEAILASLKPLVKRVILVGDCIGRGRLTAAQFPANPSPPPDAATSQLWINRSLALNSALAAAYPHAYFDMQAALVADGRSDVFNVNGTNYDVINLDVFPDGIHPTGAGANIFAAQINSIFTERGW